MRRKRASDKIRKLRKSLSPEELEDVLVAPTSEATRFFGKLVEERQEQGRILRRDPNIARQIDNAKELFSYVVADGLARSVMELFPQPSLRSAYQTDQSHEAVAEHFDRVESKDFHESALAMAQVYRVNFENIFREFLRPVADKIAGRATASNGDALKVLNEYKSAKYQYLFKSLVPHIRNSIDHSDFFIDDKHQTIVFRDRQKPELVLRHQTFRGIFMESFTLKLSVSAAASELTQATTQDILRKQERVVNFVRKHHLKLIPKEGGPTIYEVGRLLEDREGKN
jgi:hypothetical protein